MGIVTLTQKIHTHDFVTYITLRMPRYIWWNCEQIRWFKKNNFMQKARTTICACYVYQFLFSKLHSSDGITIAQMQLKKRVFWITYVTRHNSLYIFFSTADELNFSFQSFLMICAIYHNKFKIYDWVLH